MHLYAWKKKLLVHILYETVTSMHACTLKAGPPNVQNLKPSWFESSSIVRSNILNWKTKYVHGNSQTKAFQYLFATGCDYFYDTLYNSKSEGKVGTLEECVRICVGDHNCNSFTFAEKVCQLKNSPFSYHQVHVYK